MHTNRVPENGGKAEREEEEREKKPHTKSSKINIFLKGLVPNNKPDAYLIMLTTTAIAEVAAETNASNVAKCIIMYDARNTAMTQTSMHFVGPMRCCRFVLATSKSFARPTLSFGSINNNILASFVTYAHLYAIQIHDHLHPSAKPSSCSHRPTVRTE